MTPGQIACQAWTANHEAHHPGCLLVQWDDLDADARNDWEVTALAVLMTSGAPDALDAALAAGDFEWGDA